MQSLNKTFVSIARMFMQIPSSSKLALQTKTITAKFCRCRCMGLMKLMRGDQVLLLFRTEWLNITQHILLKTF